MTELGMESGNVVMKCGRNMAMHADLFKFLMNPSKVHKNK